MGLDVLVVDNNEAFATILKESLESLGDYRVTVATTAEEALSKAVEGSYRLAIVDMGLEDMEAGLLLKALREVKPSLKLMVIPVDDESPAVEGVEILGTIPKPFFVGELGEIIEDALAHSLIHHEEEEVAGVEAPAPPEAAPSEAPAPTPGAFCASEEALAILTRHYPELNAHQLVLGDLGDTCIWVGGKEEEARALHSWAVNIFKGDFPLRTDSFGELYYHSDQGSVYALRLRKGYILVALFYTEVRLGIIRLRMKELSGELLQAGG